jgi:hypothetical protein
MSEPLDWSAHLALMQQMARLAQKRSIPVTFPTKNQPFFQLGQGVHGRSFSYQSLSQMQEGLGQGGQLLWGEWLDQEFPVDQCIRAKTASYRPQVITADTFASLPVPIFHPSPKETNQPITTFGPSIVVDELITS